MEAAPASPMRPPGPPSPVAPSAHPALPGPVAAPPRNARRPFAILAGLVVLGGLAAFGYLWLTADLESTDDAQVESDVVPVAARVGGLVREKLVSDNQRVKKGDPILQLDDADLAARARQAQAELETARAQALAAEAQVKVVEASAKGGLATARAVFSGSSMGVANADAQLVAARAGLERSRAEARKAEQDLVRTKQLVEGSALPRERLDSAQAAYDSTQAALAQTTALVTAAEEQRHLSLSRVDEAKGRLDQSTPIDAQIEAARANAQLSRARVDVAQAVLDLARLQVSYTKVLAPEDGVVSKVSVQAGQMIQAGQPVAALVPGRTYVVANFKETQVGRMRPGQPVDLRVDAYPGTKLRGTVESLSGGTGARFSLLPPDNASGNFVKVVQRVPVRIAWAQPPSLPLQAGLSCDVTVDVGQPGR
ncbi:MAG TPA: HlyD family secretion protein [Myxococcales bacterium]|jgi:membrane fusion protein (multidrug efflux system)